MQREWLGHLAGADLLQPVLRWSFETRGGAFVAVSRARFLFFAKDSESTHTDAIALEPIVYHQEGEFEVRGARSIILDAAA